MFVSNSSSNRCVPNAVVCNNNNDCSYGEDEADCLALYPKYYKYIRNLKETRVSSLESHNFFYFSDNFALIIEQKYGIWEAKCFSKNSTVNLFEICSRLGYKSASAVQSQRLDRDQLQKQYRLLPTIVVEYVIPSLERWGPFGDCDAIEINCMNYLTRNE